MTRARCLRAIVLPLLLFFAACGGSSDDAPDAAVPDPVESATVSLRNLKFEPATVVLKRGGTVTWVWQDNLPHDVVGEGFKQDAKTGGTFLRSFPDKGSFDYQCTLHPGMTGTVIVK